ncbi:MAG: hypothetical protein Q9225_002946 [Loekoesia sp. 1 TL-2023]
MDPLATKYRASCDGCYLAKVKCTKERPICPRCKNLGLECKYSPSQRAGKSRRAGIQVLPTSKASGWPSNKHNSIPRSSHHRTILPTTTDAHVQQHFGARSNFESNSCSCHPSQLETGMTGDSPGGSVSMLRDLDNINFLTPWRDSLPGLDKEQFLFKGIDDFANFSSPTTTTTSPISTPGSQLSKDQELVQMTVFPVTSGCNCVSSLAQALQAMQNHSRHSNNSLPALETTLRDSKDAVARGEALLNCTCSYDSASIMLFTALIAKHLSFYGSATYIPKSPQYHHNNLIPSSSSASTSLVSTSSSSSCAAGGGEGGGSSRITIGAYTLDAEGEERLRVKIMMMELQKLGTLLAKFRAKFSSLPVGYEGHTYETVLNFLTTRLRETTDQLRRQKKKLKGEWATGEEGVWKAGKLY